MAKYLKQFLGPENPVSYVLWYILGADIGCGGEVQDIPMSYTSETVQRSYVSGKI